MDQPPARRFRPNLGVILPIALIAVIVALIIYYDFETGGDADPGPYLGEIGTPIRGTFIAATPTPRITGTPRPRPTFVTGVPGTPAERDDERRADLLVIADALTKRRAAEGGFPDTRGNTQTLCTFPSDLGCGLSEFIGGPVPSDPLGNQNGYWYESDGASARVFASFEEEVPPESICTSDWEQLQEIPFLVCVELP